MNTKSSTKLVYEVEASEESYEKVLEIMSREVSILTSKSTNATFDEMVLHRPLIPLAVSNGYAESWMKSLLLSKDGDEPSVLPAENVPSGSWIRDTVEKVPEDAMAERKYRLTPVERLYSGLLVHAYRDGLVRWIHVESDYVDYPLLE